MESIGNQLKVNDNRWKSIKTKKNDRATLTKPLYVACWRTRPLGKPWQRSQQASQQNASKS